MMFAQTLVRTVLLLWLVSAVVAAGDDRFIFHGFPRDNLTLSGQALITSGGLVRLTNNTKEVLGHAFFPVPFRFKDPSDGNKSLSFSTTFVFAIVPEYHDVSGHGITFALSPTVDLAGSMPSQHLGLFNTTDNGKRFNHVVAVEFDTVKTVEFDDIDDNHVGIDVNSLKSVNSTHASYLDNNGNTNNVSLISGKLLQAWIEYDGPTTRLDVTISPAGVPRPGTPLLSSTVQVSAIVTDKAYVGFSASTGAATGSHYVLGWSFRLNGEAQALDVSKIPPLPAVEVPGQKKLQGVLLPIALSLAGVIVPLIAVAAVICVVRRRRKYAELYEDWEEEYGPHRFSFKDLFRATNGFSEDRLLGVGGFGRVYRGVLPSSKLEIAVKKISHESQQGMREFVTEIASMGRLRHRNLVQLLGYCRRQGELLLVYEFMPNGSLDRLLFDPAKPKLSWEQRFRIVKGVASGLLYLHSGWDQVVVHRDIKAGNVLLDGDSNGRLGDFGLARLYDHGTNPQTTHVVGTLGYLAPELTKTGKFTTATDVYAFGVFLLEVACGRRPIEASSLEEEQILVDRVLNCWQKRDIMEAADPKLGGGGGERAQEVEMVLTLGLLCCHPDAAARPTMRQVVQYLEADASLPGMSPSGLHASFAAVRQSEGFDDLTMTYPSAAFTTFGYDSSSAGASFFSGSH